ncbi:unnamed protein product [Pseudo-nitzschia multistriata]|uniref:Uncharacterized protein n=1 Tax=Pseudo-nitzschia multistriata TaxID=183589 RepID=A0A448YUC8_9STRA|nr:unnamed protein product [Pseudo-nitzschia multistriata]
MRMMNQARLKFSPAIADRTVNELENDDQGMEAVLLHSKERRQRRFNRPAEVDEDNTYGEDDESPLNSVLLDLIQNKKWEKFLHRLLKYPNIARIKFSGRSIDRTSAGNLVLHEVCKYNAPIDVVEALNEANEEAIMTKGNAGYLPLHCACAHGGSIKLIRFLQSLFPDATASVDDEENALPLHLACKVGTIKEDVYMSLLTSYPAGAKIRDHFGRLPIDYAKNIQSDSHRRIAVECLKRSNWLESASKLASERTERDYQRRIRGYEQLQAQQLKTIHEVHTKEIANFEANLKTKDEEILQRTNYMEDLDRHLQDKTRDFEDRIKSLEDALKTKSRKLQSQIEKAKKETSKTQLSLDRKIEEAIDLSSKLKEAEEVIESQKKELEERTEDLQLTIEDMETLNQHSEWLESVMGSIRKLSTSVSPMAQGLEQKDELRSTGSTFVSSKKRSSARKNGDSASIRTGKSGKLSRGPSIKMSSNNSPPEKRDSSFVGRFVGSYRE